MATTNPLDILLSHDLWAMRQILDACGKLTDEQFHQRFDIGLGSLHDTTTHILGAMRWWGDLLTGREQRPRLEGTTRAVQQLQELLDEISADLSRSASTYPLDQIVTVQRGGKTFQFPRAVVLTHVATHGMHHRAQCLNMLRQLGVSPLPPAA